MVYAVKNMNSYELLLVFKAGPQLFQLIGNDRTGKFQSFEDISSVAGLVKCDKCVCVALEHSTQDNPVRGQLD